MLIFPGGGGRWGLGEAGSEKFGGGGGGGGWIGGTCDL